VDMIFMWTWQKPRTFSGGSSSASCWYLQVGSLY